MCNFRWSRRIFTVLSSFLLGGMILFSGCSPASSPTTSTPVTSPAANTPVTASTTTPAPKTIPEGVYFVGVYLNGENKASFTVDDLSKLDQVEITANGSPQNGPTLLSVLKAAGITEFTAVTASGFSRGRLATAESTLTRAQIDDSVIFDMNKRGKAKLCGANIAQSNWIIDVEKIEVK
jgi:hypothetical protein